MLRYWETEFELLKPSKAPSKHRLYKKRDVELLLEIKRLLYTEGFTIEGARKKLREAKKEEKNQLKLPLREQKYKSASGQTQERIGNSTPPGIVSPTGRMPLPVISIVAIFPN